jgi:hypothetical protein
VASQGYGGGIRTRLYTGVSVGLSVKLLLTFASTVIPGFVPLEIRD